MSIKTVISDGQFISRNGLLALLTKNGHQIIELCENRNETFTAIKQGEAEVLIIDYNRVDNFILSDLKELKNYQPELQIIAITDYTSKREVIKAIEYGVISFVTKDCGKREILDAIEATSKGEKFFCNVVLDLILEGQIEKKINNCKSSVLTERELEVVQLMALGSKAKTIAAELNLSVHTIYTHQKNIMKKLKLKSGAEVILFAINEGLTASAAT